MNHVPLSASEIKQHKGEVRAASLQTESTVRRLTWKIVRRKYITLSILEEFRLRETDI